jgi:hypothetical protein
MLIRLCVPAVLAAAALLPAPASAACGPAGYAYAGLEGWQPGHGVAATVAPVGMPRVVAGHVAAWIGVGGPGAGPKGADVWLQVGVSALPGRPAHLYYEVAQPGRAVRFVELGAAVQPGERHRVAVIEIAGRPSWWRAWVDGRAASAPLYLPGRQAWEPTATSESWDAGTSACNWFAFRFERIRVAAARGGPWKAWSTVSTMRDSGTAVRREGRTTFLASALGPEADDESAGLTVGGSSDDDDLVRVPTLH